MPLKETIRFKNSSVFVRLHKKKNMWRWLLGIVTTMSIDPKKFANLKNTSAPDEKILEEIMVHHPKQYITIEAARWFDYHSRDECFKAAMEALKKRTFDKILPLKIESIEKVE